MAVSVHGLKKNVWAQRIFPLCLFGIVGLSLIAGASSATAQSNDVNNRIKRLENEIDTLSRAVYKGQMPPAPVGGGDAAADLTGRLSQMENDLRNLTGKVEQQAYDSQQIQQRLDALEQDSRMRLDAIEGQLRGQSAQNVPPVMAPSQPNQQQPPIDPNVVIGSDQPPMAPAPQGDGAPTTNETIGQSVDAASLYEQGFSQIKREDYASAEKSFAQFLKDYPTHALAPNALYWLGETYYVRKDYDKAARAFAEAYKKYPDGPKAADNLLKLGMSLAGKKEKDGACVALGELKRKYPNGPAPVLKRGEEEMKALGCN